MVYRNLTVSIHNMTNINVRDEVLMIRIGNLLSSCFELIENILHRLNYQELTTAAQVCDAWFRVAKIIYERKRRIRFTTLHPPYHPTTNLPEGYSNSEVLEKFLESQPSSETIHCLIFSRDNWLFSNDIKTKYSPNGGTLSTVLKNAISQPFEYLLLRASGIIGSVEQSRSPTTSEFMNNIHYSVEVEETSYVMDDACSPLIRVEALSAVFLPKQPGVSIKMIKLNEKEFCKKYRPDCTMKMANEVSQTEFNSVFGLSPHDQLKAFLVFSCHLRGFNKAFIETAYSRENENVALGGGLVDLLQQNGETSRNMVALAISGKDVSTASVVVPSSVKSVMALKPYLQRLKDCGLPEGHSLCFMFSCCGRGYYWYGKRESIMGTENWENVDVETKAFRELFPHTPILGFFGQGEIGSTYLPSFNSEANEDLAGGNVRKKRRKNSKLHHQYSTVFVLLSFL